MKTNNPLAPDVANEIGARCSWIAGEGMYCLDCSQADFDEILAEFVADGTAPSAMNYAAYARLQNEGHSDKRSPRDPADEFDAGRE